MDRHWRGKNKLVPSIEGRGKDKCSPSHLKGVEIRARMADVSTSKYQKGTYTKKDKEDMMPKTTFFSEVR